MPCACHVVACATVVGPPPPWDLLKLVYRHMLSIRRYFYAEPGKFSYIKGSPFQFGASVRKDLQKGAYSTLDMDEAIDRSERKHYEEEPSKSYLHRYTQLPVSVCLMGQTGTSMNGLDNLAATYCTKTNSSLESRGGYHRALKCLPRNGPPFSELPSGYGTGTHIGIIPNSRSSDFMLESVALVIGLSTPPPLPPSRVW